MSNTRFLTNNRAIGATTENGGGGGAPARDEVASHPMENAFTADRETPWLTNAAPAGTINFDVDLGSSIALTAAGIAGFRCASSVVQVTVQEGGNAYGPGPWTTVGTFSLTGSPRDKGVTFGSTTARYWRFIFSFVVNQFSVGKLVLGVVTDLGGVHAPGGDLGPHGFRLEQPMLGGAVVLTELSTDMGRDFTLPFPTSTSALRSTLETIAALSGSFIMLDPNDAFYEVIVPEKRLGVRRVSTHGSDWLYDLDLRLKRLP